MPESDSYTIKITVTSDQTHNRISKNFIVTDDVAQRFLKAVSTALGTTSFLTLDDINTPTPY